MGDAGEHMAPEPEVAQLTIEPKTPDGKCDQPPPIQDSGAMTRTGSARSKASSPGSEDWTPTPLTRFRSTTSSDLGTGTDQDVPHVHIVESEVFAKDLTATWHDQQAGFNDWKTCFVSGSHLSKQDDGHSKTEPATPVAMADAGAKGEVLRATWKSSIQVAIKKNLNPLMQNEDEVALFLELHHPHVVACYGILKGEQDGNLTTSIVTERCTSSLEHFLDDHDQWKDKKHNTIDMMKYTIVQHIALGLQKLHDMNVLHRDIKANNILLDGTPGECPTCEHSGKWKICDFGEAKVLKTPTLSFSGHKPWPKGWSHSLIAADRFQKITSPFLRGLGARHYCWLLPGETLTPAVDHDPPPDAASPREDLEWVPCQHGGFVYSFSDNVEESSKYDRYFDISGVTDKPVAQPDQPFPETLGPFGLTPTELLPELNFDDYSYQLRKIKHQNEQLERLKSFSVAMEGKFSPVSELTLPASARRTAMIPEDATHFVWAYQAVDLEELTQEQSSKLKTDSAELSFVSLGGFVYLQQDPDNGKYRVLRANAIALEMGKTCRSGTVDRAICGMPSCNPDISHTCADGETPCDNGVTAAVASPELLDGAGIGLETDIYSFGIVMWEVFTRRKAWHWIKSGPETDNAIIAQIALGRRPKMPESLLPAIATKIRKCLHQDPAQRPTAATVTNWINRCRSELGEAMKGEQNEVVRGRDMDKDGGKSQVRKNGRAVHDRTDEHWSLRGRYSLYPSSLQTGGAGFTLTVVNCTLDDWMENALTGSNSKPEELGKLSKMKANRFGLKFEKNDGRGGKAKTWPQVAEIEQGDTIAAEFPSIKTGCVLKKINGEVVPETFKQAIPMLKARPLTLEFTSALAEHTNQVRPWIHAALLEIGLVRRHEAKKLIQHRCDSDSPRCGKPHCEDQTCTSVHPCPLKHTMSAGWMAIATPPVAVSRDAPVAVSRDFVRKCVCLAAKDAGGEAVRLLRLYEASTGPRAEIEEGEPHCGGPVDKS